MLQCGRRKMEEASAITLVDDARNSFVQQKLESLVKQAPGGSTAQQFLKSENKTRWVQANGDSQNLPNLNFASQSNDIYDIIYLGDEGVSTWRSFLSFDTVRGASVTLPSVHWSSYFRISPKAARWSRCWQIRKWKRRKRKLSIPTAHFQRQRQPHCVASPRWVLLKSSAVLYFW